MTGYLKTYSSRLQLVIFFSLFLTFYLLITILFLDVFLPMITGLTLNQAINGNYHDPQILNALKLIQLSSTVTAFLIPALLFTYLLSERPFRYVGITDKLNGWGIVLTILIMICCTPLVGILGDWNANLHLSQGLDKAIRTYEDEGEAVTTAILKMPSFGSFLYSLVIIAVLPAIAEELFFRGLLQRILVKATHSMWFGIILTAAIFSALHFEFLGFLPRMALGIIIGAIYAYSGNLWLAILAHFFNNGIQVILVYLYQLKWIKIDVTKDTPTPWLAALASLVIVGALIWIFRSVTAKQKEDFEQSILLS